MKIAGRKVQIGDRLFHIGMGLWGQAVEVDSSGSVVFEVGNRRLLSNDGGKINGKRQLYWHEPILLDLPMNDLGPYRRILEAILREGL